MKIIAGLVGCFVVVACSRGDRTVDIEKTCAAVLTLTLIPGPDISVGDSIEARVIDGCGASPKSHWTTSNTDVAAVRTDSSSAVFVFGKMRGSTILQAALLTDASAKAAALVTVR